MKKAIIFIILLTVPLFAVAQNTAMRLNQQQMNNRWMMKKMMTPTKIDFAKIVKREESRVKKLELENNELNTKLLELKSQLYAIDDSKKEKINKKIEKIQEKLEKNNNQIVNSNIIILSYKKE